MNTLKNILVVADPRMRTTAAIERGAELALRMGARVQLCLFDYDWKADDFREAGVQRRTRDTFTQERSGWLSRQAAALSARGLSVSGEFISTLEPHRAVLAKVLQLDPDLVVKDMHQPTEYPWLAPSPDEDRLLNFCPAPVLLVRPGSSGLPRRILAAVDTGSGAAPAASVNDRIAQTAQALGESLGAAIHLAHVFPHKVLTGDAYQILRDTESATRTVARGYFERFAQRFGFAPEFYHWVEGKPAEALAELVTRLGADWLVIGHVYHTLMKEFLAELVGSTTERLLGRTASDVIFVQPDDYVAELGRHIDLDAVCREFGVAWRRAA